jgi:hypothetical protein
MTVVVISRLRLKSLAVSKALGKVTLTVALPVTASRKKKETKAKAGKGKTKNGEI